MEERFEYRENTFEVMLNDVNGSWTLLILKRKIGWKGKFLVTLGEFSLNEYKKIDDFKPWIDKHWKSI